MLASLSVERLSFFRPMWYHFVWCWSRPQIISRKLSFFRIWAYKCTTNSDFVVKYFTYRSDLNDFIAPSNSCCGKNCNNWFSILLNLVPGYSFAFLLNTKSSLYQQLKARLRRVFLCLFYGETFLFLPDTSEISYFI